MGTAVIHGDRSSAAGLPAKRDLFLSFAPPTDGPRAPNPRKVREDAVGRGARFGNAGVDRDAAVRAAGKIEPWMCAQQAVDLLQTRDVPHGVLRDPSPVADDSREFRRKAYS